MRAVVAWVLIPLSACGFSISFRDSIDASTDDASTDDDAPPPIDAAPTPDAPIDAQLCATAPSGLIAWWPGDNANEIIGQRTSVLTNGAQANTAGKVGGAFTFDGDDDCVDIQTDVPALTEFTIEGWIDFGTSTNSWRTVFGNDVTGPGLWMKDRRIDWFQSSGDRFTSPTTISATGWHHFALTYDASVFRGYVDGATAGTMTYAGAYLPGGATIGGEAGYELDGKIDELSIYNRVLTPTEISAIVTADSNGKCR